MKQLSEHYLEDFAVGQTFRSGRLRIDGERALAFAAEFDPQPFHLDEAAARRSIFGELTASGWHTAAVTMRLLVETATARPELTRSQTRRTCPARIIITHRKIHSGREDAQCSEAYPVADAGKTTQSNSKR